MSQPLHTAFIDLLDNQALSDREIRRLIGWYALSLTDLLLRKCITLRYAERVLFNLEVVQKLEQRHLADCVELIDWGMQLEDWEDHTPEHLSEALTTIARLAQRLLTTRLIPSSGAPKLVRQRIQRASHRARSA